MAIKQSKKATAPVAQRTAAPAEPKTQPLSTDRVAMRAYEIWQESGCQHGQHEDHWYRAERELRNGASR